MDSLPRNVFIYIIKLTVQKAPRDQMRLLGIQPGKLMLPRIHIEPASHTHGHGSATLCLKLPHFKEYVIQRVIHFGLPDGRSEAPLGDQLWETSSLNIVRGHPCLHVLFDGEEVSAWVRSCVGQYVEESAD